MSWQCVKCDTGDPFDPPARTENGDPCCIECEPTKTYIRPAFKFFR